MASLVLVPPFFSSCAEKYPPQAVRTFEAQSDKLEFQPEPSDPERTEWELICQTKLANPVQTLSFSQENQLAVGSKHGRLDIWDMNRCNRVRTYQLSFVSFRDLYFDDNQLIVSSGLRTAIIAPETGIEKFAVLHAIESYLPRWQVLITNEKLAGSGPARYRFWNAGTLRQIPAVDSEDFDQEISDISDDFNYVVRKGDWERLELVDRESGKVLDVIHEGFIGIDRKAKEHMGSISYDQKYGVVAWKQSVRLYGLESHSRLYSIRSGPVKRMQFSPVDDWLLHAFSEYEYWQDGITWVDLVRAGDRDFHQRVGRVDGRPMAVDWSDDGTMIAVGTNIGDVSVWRRIGPESGD